MYAVSVIVPVHGAAAFLKPALDSILSQRGIPFEIICVDDEASKLAIDCLTQMAARTSDLKVVPSAGRGISNALNSGVALATGRLVARMDADDISLPDRLVKQADYLSRHPRIGVLGTQAIAIDAAGNRGRRIRVPVSPTAIRSALETSSPLIHPTVMIRRELLLGAGGYRPMFDGAEDYDLWLRLSRCTQLANLGEALLLYRRHKGQTSQQQSFRQARLSALALVAHRAQLEPVGLSGAGNPASLGRLRASPAASDFCCLAAPFLVNNGGTLRQSGARYLRYACARAVRRDSPDIARGLALACVRHQLQLARAGRWRDALSAARSDFMRWRADLLMAYFRHAAILWHTIDARL